MGEDRRPRRRRRRAGPEPRQAAGGDRRPGRRLPAALPLRRRAGRDGRRAGRCASRTRSRRTAPTDLRIVDVAANGYRLRLVDHPAAFDRDGDVRAAAAATTPTTPGGSGSSAGPRSRRSRSEGERPVDVIHLHDWHGGPAAIQRDAWLADDPVVGRAAIVTTLHNLAYHGWTDRSAASPARARAGWRDRPRGRPRRRPDPGGDRPGRGREHRQPRLRPRGADPGRRASGSTTPCGRRATGSSGS